MSEFMPAVKELLAIIDERTRPAADLRAVAVTMCNRLERATQPEKEEALAQLASRLTDADSPTAGMIAVCCGAIIENGGDPVPLVDPLIARLRPILPQAVIFAEQCEQLADSTAPPAPAESGEAEVSMENPVERYGADVAAKLPQAAKAWAATESLGMAAIAAMAHSKEVRALFRATNLHTVIDALARFHPEAHYLFTLMEALDDEELMVLHPETKQGFRIRIAGIADNFQLHTLLAGLLAGPESMGKLPGERPGEPLIAAAIDQPVDPEFDYVYGPFNLANWIALSADGTLGPANDHPGAWIWNEGRPSDILPFAGTRIVLLETPPYERGWQAGRMFPGMIGEMELLEVLSANEVQSWLTRMGPAQRPT